MVVIGRKYVSYERGTPVVNGHLGGVDEGAEEKLNFKERETTPQTLVTTGVPRS